MNETDILEEILHILDGNNIEIRRESLGGNGGGLFRIKGKPVFFVDCQAGAADMAALAGEALKEYIDLEKTYIKPEVREFIENANR